MKYLGEFHFNSYLYKNKKILEEIMEINIKNIELEKNIGIGCVRKVDISGTTLDNKIFLGEVQLGNADYIHLKQTISNIKTGADIIFWIAGSFDKKMIRKLKIRAKQHAIKTTKIYLIKVNKEVRNTIRKTEGYVLEKFIEVMDGIKELIVLDKYIEVEKEKQISEQYYKFKDMFNYSNKGDLEVIFDFIKEVIKDDFRICSSKTINRPSFNIGSGVSDISFRISINKKNVIIALIFLGEMKKIFIKINEGLKNRMDINKALEKKIKVDEKYSKFYMDIGKDKDFQTVALEFREFYCYFKGILKDIFLNDREFYV